ncbi:Uncharacterised protein [Pannonibacter phragmitetus]|uniref:Uncharacterized protein n=1 Tax=Pannonibacter phragmitetus TaxID=121719 RepID=A0A378ZTG6_9HYPH|nr:Uncharacterised protein [Pannonibacter phragmitetus]
MSRRESNAVNASVQIVLAGAQLKDLAAPAARSSLTASEFYVLQRLRQLKLTAALRRTHAPLTSEMRKTRVEGLIALWKTGCSKAVDESLYADLERRARQTLPG